MDTEAKVRCFTPCFYIWRYNDLPQVLLLGSGDSGKSTFINQMRILTKVPWKASELEWYRQAIFSNLIDGMTRIVQSLDDSGTSLKGDSKALDAYKVSRRPLSKLCTALDLVATSQCILTAPDVQEGESFPRAYYEALHSLWSHPQIQEGLVRPTHPLLKGKYVPRFPIHPRLI
jgi:hypothetical protein